MKKDEKGLEVEDPCGGVQKYMSSEEMDELRRTSRTVCSLASKGVCPKRLCPMWQHLT